MATSSNNGPIKNEPQMSLRNWGRCEDICRDEIKRLRDLFPDVTSMLARVQVGQDGPNGTFLPAPVQWDVPNPTAYHSFIMRRGENDGFLQQGVLDPTLRFEAPTLEEYLLEFHRLYRGDDVNQEKISHLHVWMNKWENLNIITSDLRLIFPISELRRS